MAIYIIELEVDGIPEEDAEITVGELTATLNNRIYALPNKEYVQVAAVYKLDNEESCIVSDGDLLYP